MPDTDTIRTATHACIVTADRLAHLSIEPNHGGGPYVIPRYLLPRSLRPAQDKRRKGIDRSTINGLEGPFEWRVRDLNPFQHIGFRGTPHLTPYSRLIERWGVGEEVDNPWPLLAEHYPPDLVDRARAALQAS